MIPSKGRPATPLPGVLSEFDVTVFVEPQDHASYPSGLKYHILPENNAGITYVRNYILKHAKQAGLKSFWMMDDDIKDFTKCVGRKLQKCDPREVLEPAEAHFRSVGAAQGALEYRPFGWLGKHSAMDSYCDVCVWMDVDQIQGVAYDATVSLKEDRDFTIQLLQAGKRTCRYMLGSFNTPANASNKGGLHEVYKSGKEAEAVEAMCRKWPWICSVHQKKNGRKDCKINWQAARVAKQGTLW